MRWKVKELVKLFKLYPEAPIAILCAMIEHRWEEKNKAYKEQEIAPYYVSLNGGLL